MSKRKWLIGLLVVLVLTLLAMCFVPIFQVYALPNEITIVDEDLDKIRVGEGLFGKIVKAQAGNGDIAADTTDKVKNNYIDFKLFSLIPIKRQKINVLSENEVLVGGIAVGFALKADGALVIGSSSIMTSEGAYDIATLGSLKPGDLITKIDNKRIYNTSDISHYLNNRKYKDKEIVVTYIRNGKEYDLTIKPVYDINSKIYRLGVWVRDDASGIGTLTYITKDNRFGALGHPLCDADAKSIVSVKTGKVYNCSILGVNKGRAGNPGELRGMFLHGGEEQGVVDKNNNYGIFGEMQKDSNIFTKLNKAKIGGRFSVKPGKAQIKCSIDGNLKLYDIEIIKTNYNNYNNDKSMIIRVVDKDLLSKTGGIVQGMSGSPILQDGKIVGAVTHVFVNDPTKGYGVYLDFMLKE